MWSHRALTAQLNAALDRDKNETQVAQPAEDHIGLTRDVLQGPSFGICKADSGYRTLLGLGMVASPIPVSVPVIKNHGGSPWRFIDRPRRA
jgi:hypothetical protein